MSITSRCISAAISAVCIFVGSVAGQVWGPVATTGPSAIGPMAFDSLRGRAVSVTGSGTSIYDEATRAWSLVGLAGPGSRTGVAMTYDAARDRIVLFGGGGLFSVLSETWEFNGATATWTRILTPQSPPARRNAAMAFDASRSRIVLCGGENAGFPLPTPFADTWEYDGTTWSQVAIPSPSFSIYPWQNNNFMAYDSARQRLLMVKQGSPWFQAWEYDGSLPAWIQVPGLANYQIGPLTYDPARSRFVMCAVGSVGHTLEYVPATQQWTRVSSSPAISPVTALYHDPLRARTVMHVGSASPTPGTYELDVNTIPVSATVTEYGRQCLPAMVSFAELFDQLGSFDLGGTVTQTNGVQLHPTGYLSQMSVTASGNQWFVPTSPNLGLGDDDVTTVSLPFTFPFGSATTTSLDVCSNGWISLGYPLIPMQPNQNLPYLIWYGPVLAPFWHDLDPTAGGTVHFDIDPSGMAAYLTWSGVPTWARSGTTCTFQVALFATGDVEYRYRLMAPFLGLANNGMPTAVVGWSPGNGAPGSLVTSEDLSAAIPFLTGPGPVDPPRANLDLYVATPPIVNTTLNMSITGVPVGTNLLWLVFGTTKYDPGLDLGFIGMPGCLAHTSIDLEEAWLPSGLGSDGRDVFVPNVPGLVGVHVYAQVALFVPGYTPLGLLVSNAADLLIGNN